MGLFWDLIQHGQIREQATRALSLENRVTRLESQLIETQKLLLSTLERLEKHLNTDLNQDGRVGS